MSLTDCGLVLSDTCRGFFSVGMQYRQPCFLATSFVEGMAELFHQMAQAQGFQTVIWVVRVDPMGGQDMAKRCKHVNFVEHSRVADEQEYLFTAYMYSIFTVHASSCCGVGSRQSAAPDRGPRGVEQPRGGRGRAGALDDAGG